MRNSKYRGGRCQKESFTKSKEICRLYDPIQIAYARQLDQRKDIQSFQCNVLLDGIEDEDRKEGQFTTDFLCIRTDETYMVRECVSRKKLMLPRTAKLLDASRDYWLRHGIEDWGIVVEEEHSNDK